MLYYYFKNKNDLYEEIVYVEFLKINEKLKKELPVHLHIKEIYAEYILQRKRLSEYEKSIGDGEGFMPLELLLLSLASCSGSTVVSLLRRMKRIDSFKSKCLWNKKRGASYRV